MNSFEVSSWRQSFLYLWLAVPVRKIFLASPRGLPLPIHPKVLKQPLRRLRFGCTKEPPVNERQRERERERERERGGGRR